MKLLQGLMTQILGMLLAFGVVISGVLLIMVVSLIISLPVAWVAWFALGMFSIDIAFAKVWIGLFALMAIFNYLRPNKRK